jgi:hypothetical protein
MQDLSGKILRIGEYWILEFKILVLRIMIAGIYLSGPIGKKLDNLCPKHLHFLMRQYANTPTTFSTFQLFHFSSETCVRFLSKSG